MAIKNNYITVAYQLFVKEGENEKEELVEECSAEHPFMFISKLNAVLEPFEAAIDPLNEGDKFDFVIPCDEAYGQFDEQLMFDVPKVNFMYNGKFDSTHIFEGNIIPLQGEDGTRFNGVVIEVKEDAVTIDLNHPRAGQDLHFVGTVVTHREATNEEITQMITALSGGCGGCGGHCGGGDCGGCGEDRGCGSSCEGCQ
jgi:FKBP-type peptidyl-prolyl cis-trans isomerase SlyD